MSFLSTRAEAVVKSSEALASSEPADEIDLLRQLFRRARGRAFVQQAGDEVRESCFVGRILRGTGLDQRMDFNDREEMLFKDEHGHAVCGHKFRRCDLCRHTGTACHEEGTESHHEGRERLSSRRDRQSSRR